MQAESTAPDANGFRCLIRAVGRSRGGFVHPAAGANLADVPFLNAASGELREAGILARQWRARIDGHKQGPEHEGDRLRGNRYAFLSCLSGVQEPGHVQVGQDVSWRRLVGKSDLPPPLPPLSPIGKSFGADFSLNVFFLSFWAPEPVRAQKKKGVFQSVPQKISGPEP